jgi:hypothetical protein
MLKACGPQYISRGVRVSRSAPWISHLLFVDDCLIFTQASRRGAERISKILDDYSKGSEQLVNKRKSAVFFSDNCDQDSKGEVHQALQIPTEALGENIWDSQQQWGMLLMAPPIMSLIGSEILSMGGQDSC